MSRARFSTFGLAFAVTVIAACGGNGHGAKRPGPMGRLPAPLASAFREDATGDLVKAIDLYARALDNAVTSPDDPAHVAVAMASLDALVHRSVSAFADVAITSSLSDRVDPAALSKNGGTVDERLAKILDRAEGPFSAHLVAVARLALAERRGDSKTAEAMRARSGCVREALVFGPCARDKL